MESFVFLYLCTVCLMKRGDRMKSVYNGVIVMGLAIAIFFSYQWWQSTQSVQPMASESLLEEAHSTSLNHRSAVQEVEGERRASSSEPQSNDQLTYYSTGENIGQLSIPELNKTYDTFWGTDDATLHQGVGMYVSEWTTTPDEKGHTVLSGHRDTVFSELGELVIGDQLIVEFDGIQYVYEINDTWITDAEDRTVIVKKDEATLTVTTCYPFQYLGAAPDRYIIQSHLVATYEM